MPKRNCKFSSDLEKEYPFLKKVCASSNQGDRVRCSHCNTEFSVAHGGRSDIKDHVKSNKHKNSLSAAATSSKVTTFFQSAFVGDQNLARAAKEATFAYHTVNHNLSFNSNACSSKLVSKFYDQKFSLGKTKSEAIVVGVIAPFAENEIRQDLEKSHFVPSVWMLRIRRKSN